MKESSGRKLAMRWIEGWICGINGGGLADEESG